METESHNIVFSAMRKFRQVTMYVQNLKHDYERIVVSHVWEYT